MSKRLAVLQALIMLMSLVVVSGFAAAQENETTIDTSVTWEADGGLLTCDYDHVRIMDGGVLTIRDALVDLTCNITVDEGGILNLDNSMLECGIWDEPGNPDGIQ